MTAPAVELQKAIFAALGTNAALTDLVGPRIHDAPPANTPFPYISFGRTSIYDWSTATESGTEQLFTLHVWSKARGKQETLSILDLAEASLHEAALTLAGHTLVSLRREYSEVRYDEDLTLFHGLLRFRAVTEPNA
jgi:hypothetical protein